MGACCDKIKKLDPDDVFAYKTPKIVIIRDRWLGLISYGFMIGIFIYIVIYNVIIQRGYLVVEDPIGSIRLTLRRPDTFNDPTQLPYCVNSTAPLNFGAKLPCLYWNRFDAFHTQDNSAFITTRVSLANYQDAPAGCERSLSPNCVYPEPGTAQFNTRNNETIYYIAQPENFTLGIEHTVRGRSVDVTDSSTNLKGKLVDADDKVITRFPPDGSLDIIPLWQILQLTTLPDLDVKSDISNNSARYDGTVIIVFIDYTNRISKTDEIKYTYRIKRVSNTDFNFEDVIYEDYSRRRITARNKHGIKIIMLQIGKIGAFSFSQLLTSLVNGFVLLSAAATLTDLLAIYVMPNKNLYKEAKFQTTDDFSDVRDMLKKKQESNDIELN